MGLKSETRPKFLDNFWLNENLGQHLLIDKRAIELFVRQINKGLNVLEIGPGTGALTVKISQLANKVVGIEIDKRFSPFLEKLKARHKNIEIIYKDAISLDFNKLIKQNDSRPWQVASNLPFHISEPFLQKLINLPIKNVVLIIGDQLIRRMQTLNLESHEFTKLSLLTQTFFDLKLVAHLEKTSFYPKPRTNASIVILTPKFKNKIESSFYTLIIKNLFLSERKNPTVIKVIKNTLNGKARMGINDLRLPNTILSKPFSKLSNQEIKVLLEVLRTVFNYHPLDEYLDLVDQNDNIIDKMKRSEIYSKDLSNFRTVNAFLINSNGQIWIPRRAQDKRIFPLCLDMSMGGHVESGESYDQAFKRELKEELNLDADTIVFKVLGKVNPQKNNTSCFSTIYEIKSDLVPDYNKGDFVEYFWLNPEDILERIDGGDKAKSDLSKLVKIFYPKTKLQKD